MKKYLSLTLALLVIGSANASDNDPIGDLTTTISDTNPKTKLVNYVIDCANKIINNPNNDEYDTQHFSNLIEEFNNDDSKNNRDKTVQKILNSITTTTKYNEIYEEKITEKYKAYVTYKVLMNLVNNETMPPVATNNNPQQPPTAPVVATYPPENQPGAQELANMYKNINIRQTKPVREYQIPTVTVTTNFNVALYQ